MDHKTKMIMIMIKFGIACCFLVLIGIFILPLGIARIVNKIQMNTCHGQC